MDLFSKYKRTDFRPKQNLESSFSFLDRSAWTISELARSHLKRWLDAFPWNSDFIKKLTSLDDQQHQAAVFELILYSLMRNHGFSVEVHPDLSGRSKPDFKVSDNKGLYCYMECTLAGNSYESLGEMRRKEAVLKIIDDLIDFPYYIGVDFVKVSKSSISKGNLLKFLDIQAQESVSLTNGKLIRRKRTFHDNGWELEIMLFKKTVPGRMRNVGFQSGRARTIDPKKTVLGALNDKKPSKYSLNNEIFLIAVNETDPFSDSLASTELLFGVEDYDQINLRHSRLKGFFCRCGEPINTSIAALIRCRQVSLHTLMNCQIKILHNPFAKTPLPIGKFPFDEEYYTLENKTLHGREVTKNTNVLRLLGMNELEYMTAYESKSIEATK